MSPPSSSQRAQGSAVGGSPGAPAPLMLGVSGCRGIVGASLTPEVATRFAQAFASWLCERSSNGSPGGKRRPVVVLARDGRPGGQMVRDAAAAGLALGGCDIVDLGVAMTPTAGVMVDHVGASAGMVITASHNPQQWNGLKAIVREGGVKGKASASAPPKAIADEIVERFRSGAGVGVRREWSQIGSTSFEQDAAASAHVKLVLTTLRGLRGSVLGKIAAAKIRVALDCVNGAGATIAPAFLKTLGCRVHAEGVEPGSVFPHTPEPTAENLGGLCRLVKKHGCGVGFAQDPDADRLALVDERGRYIGEEYTLVLAARAVLELAPAGSIKKGAKIAVNMSTSRMIEDLAARYGCKVLRTPVGEANVVEVMKRERCIIGGEGNGGVILPGVTYIRDSLSAMGLVLALMAATGKTLSELVGEMPRYSIDKRKVDLPRREDAQPAVEKLSEAFRGVRVDRQDGVRIDWDNHPEGGAAWLHVRASNTEPIMRLIAEAPTPVQASGILEEAAKIIHAERVPYTQGS